MKNSDKKLFAELRHYYTILIYRVITSCVMMHYRLNIYSAVIIQILEISATVYLPDRR